jgi:16S rRNA pseudouridine516 synthase
MRLDRFLSHATGLSRSQSLRAIRQGQVRVEGVPVTDPGAPVSLADSVEYAGEVLSMPGFRYLMLYKPAGYVCATRDASLPTVLTLIDVPRHEQLHIGRSRSPSSRGTRASLHIAGRLDVDATGLVLISDDGDWTHRVTAPRHEFPKTYRVSLAEPLSGSGAAQLARGVLLHNEKHRCRPAEIERITDTEIRVTVTEGRYHQVKRMFASVGNRVTALHRERIGAVVLDARLKAGESRALTEEEVESFRTRPR